MHFNVELLQSQAPGFPEISIVPDSKHGFTWQSVRVNGHHSLQSLHHCRGLTSQNPFHLTSREWPTWMMMHCLCLRLDGKARSECLCLCQADLPWHFWCSITVWDILQGHWKIKNHSCKWHNYRTTVMMMIAVNHTKLNSQDYVCTLSITCKPAISDHAAQTFVIDLLTLSGPSLPFFCWIISVAKAAMSCPTEGGICLARVACILNVRLQVRNHVKLFIVDLEMISF